MDSNKRCASRTGTKNREGVPIGTGPTLDGGGDAEAPGRAYSSVQCLALLSCCFLLLTYSVAIDGTVGGMAIWCQIILGAITGMVGMPYRADPLVFAHRSQVPIRKRTDNRKIVHLRGLGSVSNDERDNITLNIERAGDH